MGTSKQVRAAELLRLRDWCLTVIQYLRELEPELDPERSFEASYEAGYQMGNLRGFRAAARDLLEMVVNRSAAEQQVLDSRLRSKLGVGLERDVGGVKDDVEAALKRGRVANDREFRALRARLELIDRKRDREEAERIEALLWRFEQRRSRVGRGGKRGTP